MAILKGAGQFEQATDLQLARARELHGSNEVNIDSDAGTSDPEDGSGYWVQAWVWVDALDFDDDDGADDDDPDAEPDAETLTTTIDADHPYPGIRR